MGNWKITISGVGPKSNPKGYAWSLVKSLVADGQNVKSAEFWADTAEDCLNLLAERDEAAAAKLTDKGHDAAQVEALEVAEEARTTTAEPEAS